MMRTCDPARRLGLLLVSVCACALAYGTRVGASDQAVVVVRFQTAIQPSTSLRVSGDVLVIESHAGDGPVEVGSISFRAAARTARGGDVLLTVEPLSSVQGLGGGPGTLTAISFVGSGVGVQDGVLRDGRPETVARWVGSGLHTGRVTFVVSGPLPPQGASVPLRFLLTSP